jgi:hypothetical protein
MGKIPNVHYFLLLSLDLGNRISGVKREDFVLLLHQEKKTFRHLGLGSPKLATRIRNMRIVTYVHETKLLEAGAKWLIQTFLTINFMISLRGDSQPRLGSIGLVCV